MKILVANLGSTSFKFRLFDMDLDDQLARGSIESLGQAQSQISIQVGDFQHAESISIIDHAAALNYCLDILRSCGIECAKSGDSFAIGFKAVHGGRYTGIELVDDRVLAEMERMQIVAPAHNPPYVKAMRQLMQEFPGVPLVAAFETNFHEDAPREFQTYAIPHEWTEEFSIRRLGFHGASHRYIAERMKQLAPNARRIISCHLGGSSSLCAIDDGKSMGASMGFSPQSGLPQSNRCGDLDPFVIPALMDSTGKSLDEILTSLATESGLLGVSGVSPDLRSVIEAADHGNRQAELAVDLYVSEIRRHLGGMLTRLNGADAIVFTGGIGERSSLVRSRVCKSLNELGIELEESSNRQPTQPDDLERTIHTDTSRIELWIVPTNEEIVVARQTVALLENQKCL